MVGHREVYFSPLLSSVNKPTCALKATIKCFNTIYCIVRYIHSRCSNNTHTLYLRLDKSVSGMWLETTLVLQCYVCTSNTEDVGQFTLVAMRRQMPKSLTSEALSWLAATQQIYQWLWDFNRPVSGIRYILVLLMLRDKYQPVLMALFLVLSRLTFQHFLFFSFFHWGGSSKCGLELHGVRIYLTTGNSGSLKDQCAWFSGI